MNRFLLCAFVSAAGCSSSSVSKPAATAPASASASVDPARTSGVAVHLAAQCVGMAALTVTPEGVEVAIEGSGDGAVRTIARRDGAIDHDALRAASVPSDASADCAGIATVSARGDVTYQDLVTAMDAALSAGRTDIGLVGGSSAMYPDPPRRPQPTEQEVIDSLGKPRFGASTPLVIMTRTSIRIEIAKQETIIDDVEPIGDADALTSLHEALREARAAAASTDESVLLLQADRATPARLVIDASSAARAAGYDNVLFAVK